MLVHSSREWTNISHPGRSGSDDGVDISAIEHDEDGKERRWAIQCKRYQSFTPQQAKDAIDAAVEKANDPIDTILLVVGCSVSKSTHDQFKAHADEKGIQDALIWDASYLESTLYNDRQDLLFTYFGVDIRAKQKNREALINRRLTLKNKMRRDFLLSHAEWEERNKQHKVISLIRHSNWIIRNIDDDTYPNIDLEPKGISPWFKIEPLDFYHNGVEVIVTTGTAIFDDNNRWDILDSHKDPRKERYQSAYVWMIGRIHFDNIVNYDLDGEICPHIYCKFTCGSGEPYEEFVYAIPKETWVEHLPKERQTKLP